MGYLNNQLEKVASSINERPMGDSEGADAKLVSGVAAALAGTGALAASPVLATNAINHATAPLEDIVAMESKLHRALFSGALNKATRRQLYKELTPEARDFMAMAIRHARRTDPYVLTANNMQWLARDLLKKDKLALFKAQRLPGKLKLLAPILAVGGGIAAAGYGAKNLYEGLNTHKDR